MSNIAPIDSGQSLGILASLASHYGMDKGAFVQTMKATVMNGANVSNEQLAAFCLVAKEHRLNPFTKEIFAFPQRGGIVPVVSVDGWMKLVNSHPQFDGMEFRDTLAANGDLVAVTCRIFRKDRQHAIEVTEYMSECRRTTDVWKTWPARMLRHKATIQAARYAFGFAGIMEPDEVERMGEVQVIQPRTGRNAVAALEAPHIDLTPLLNRLRQAGEDGGREAIEAAFSEMDEADRAAIAGNVEAIISEFE